jgi:hypothetical protein
VYALEARLTILRDTPNSKQDPEALALAALGWVLSDDDHAERFLALTGVSPEELRARIGEQMVLIAALDFLMSYEPDLIAAATALGVEPQVLANAHAQLTGPQNPDEAWQP